VLPSQRIMRNKSRIPHANPTAYAIALEAKPPIVFNTERLTRTAACSVCATEKATKHLLSKRVPGVGTVHTCRRCA
jgi:hypothetical protein